MSARETIKAMTATIGDDEGVVRGIETLNGDALPADGVLIEVAYSSVNYKDALATIKGGQVARISPLIPGIDLAGTVVESGDDRFAPGDLVLAHGYELGTARHGGYAEQASVPADWLVAMPSGLSPREAMLIGTAGFTAAMSVLAVERHQITPDAGPVLVTGATGGVGSCAVALLAGLGYEVHAVTGKPEAETYLRDLGAVTVLARDEFTGPTSRPLARPLWAAAVDCVGGQTLANILPQTMNNGIVAASGLTGGPDLATTVLPFIMRGVTLAGMDSVQLGIEKRTAVWTRLATDLRLPHLDRIGHEVGLDGVDDVLTDILAGRVQGRVIVRCS